MVTPVHDTYLRRSICSFGFWLLSLDLFRTSQVTAAMVGTVSPAVDQCLFTAHDFSSAIRLVSWESATGQDQALPDFASEMALEMISAMSSSLSAMSNSWAFFMIRAASRAIWASDRG